VLSGKPTVVQTAHLYVQLLLHLLLLQLQPDLILLGNSLVSQVLQAGPQPIHVSSKSGLLLVRISTGLGSLTLLPHTAGKRSIAIITSPPEVSGHQTQSFAPRNTFKLQEISEAWQAHNQ
jgi:hypothetical protein